MAEPFDYDVLVIGAGPGGYVAAIRAAQLGLRTACVESRGTLGGTCLNVGCIPSKALLHASEVFAEVAGGHLEKFGVTVQGASLDLTRMHGEKDRTVADLTGGIEFLFKKNKVSWLKGRARFIDAHTVEIDGRQTTAANIVIATGSSPAALAGVDVDGRVVVDSTGALALPEVPKRLVVIGGGVIGLELGSVWRRCGSEVTVVEALDQILAEFDGEVRKEAATMFGRQGLRILTATRVEGVVVKDGLAQVTIRSAASGEVETLEADVVLVATGRRPNVEGLDVKATGLELNGRGRIATDSDFRTLVPGVWAIGDVIEGPMLAHRASDEGMAVAETIAGLPGTVNHALIPSVVYTTPEIAGVGLTEEAARERGQVKVGRFPFVANSRAKANRSTDGFVKVIAEAGSDRVLGVWIVSTLGGTMIAQAVQAMEFGATSEDIAYTCHAHPTHSEALKEAAMAVLGKPIHV